MGAVRTFKWIVEIEVDEAEVVDGINFSKPDLLWGGIIRGFPSAHASAFEVKVIKSPSPESIAIAQGAYKRLGYCGDAMRDTYHVGVEVDGKRYLLCDRSNKYALPSEEELPEGATVCPECKRRDES